MPTVTQAVRVSIPDAAYWTRCRVCGVLIATTDDAPDLCWSCEADVHGAFGLTAADLAIPLTSTVRGAR